MCKLSVFVLLVCLVANPTSQAQKTPDQSKDAEADTATRTIGAGDRNLEPERWREDLEFLVSELQERHVNLFHSVDEETFDRLIESLDKKIPSLSPHEIIVEMARLVALVGEGHTRLNLPADGRRAFRRFPIRFYLYKEGLFVQSAPKEYARDVGARVLKIGNFTVEQVLKRVSAIIHHDNPMTTKLLIPSFISTPEVLHALGITNSLDKASILVEQQSGETFSIELLAQPRATEADWVDARNKNSPPPLWIQDQQNKYWFKYLDDSRTIYLQFNAANDKEGESLAAFANRLDNFIASNPVEKLILDIRLNDGGNSRLTLPLLHALIKSDKINKPGKLFVIIGRATFSAAMVFAVEVEKHTNAIFIGEPTGGQPNQYGEMLSFTLPNSGLSVSYSAYYFQTAGPFDNRKWIAPTIATELSAADYKSSRDPALDAALNYIAPKPLSETLLPAIANAGVQAAIVQYQKFKTAPANAYLDTETEIRRLGDRLLEMKRVDEAIAILKLNVEAYPDRARPYYSLAEAYSVAGDKERAESLYEKGLTLLRDDQSIHKGLRERLRLIARERLEQLRQ